MAGANTIGAFAPTQLVYPQRGQITVVAMAILLGMLVVLFTPLSSLAEEAQLNSSTPATDSIAKKDAVKTKDILGSARTDTPSLMGQITKGMIYCIGALIMLLGLYHQFGPSKGVTGGAINIISQRALTSKHSLILAEVEGKKLLLGAGGDQLTLISDFTEAPQPVLRSTKKEGAISVAVNNG